MSAAWSLHHVAGVVGEINVPVQVADRRRPRTPQPVNAGTYYVQAFFTSSSPNFTNAQSGIVSFNIAAKTLTVDATTQGTLNIAKAGTISFALQITAGLIADNNNA